MDSGSGGTSEIPPPPGGSHQTQRCNGCKAYKPLTPEHFHRNRSKQSGFHDYCRECRSQKKEERAQERDSVMAVVQELEQADLKMLQRIANSPDPVEPTTLPHVSTVLEHVMTMFGGSEGYARCVMAEFLASKPGSTQRQKLLDMVLRLTSKVTDSGAARVPLKHLSDEDLNREITRRLKVVDSEVVSKEEE